MPAPSIFMENNDDKEKKLKSIFQLLILKKICENTNDENDNSTATDSYFEGIAKDILKEAKELCFDDFVNDNLTKNFSDEMVKKLIPIKDLDPNPDPDPDSINNLLATIIKNKEKQLTSFKKANAEKFKSLQDILKSDDLTHSIITDGNFKSENKKSRELLDTLFKENTASSNNEHIIDSLSAEFNPQSEPNLEVICDKFFKSNFQKLYSNFLTTTSNAIGFINLAIKDISKHCDDSLKTAGINSTDQKKPSPTTIKQAIEKLDNRAQFANLSTVEYV